MLDNRLAPCFIDTNIWLYAFVEGGEPAKSALARDLIQRSEPVISSQVVNEVCVNLLRRANIGEEQIRMLIRSFYRRYRVVDLTVPVLLRASDLRERHRLSFWDSLIVAAAVQAGTSVLYSEDMQHGLTIDDAVEIRNPFVR